MKQVWQHLIGDYLTPGGDPIWVCPICLNGEHIYGVEHRERIHNCPVCGTELIYPDEEKEIILTYPAK